MKRLPILGLILAVIVVVLDQATKLAVVNKLKLDEFTPAVDVTDFFRLRFVANHGVSLGLLHANSEAMRWGLVALTAAIAVGVLFWMFSERNRQDQFGLGLVLGGALGNIADRVRLGYVVDYADLHFGDWSPFLVFNLGDAAITIGVLILLIRAFLVRDTPKGRKVSVENSNA